MNDQTFAVPSRRSPLSRDGLALDNSAQRLAYSLIAFCAFGLYVMSALVLQHHNRSSGFGADSVLYVNIAYGDVADRIWQFHPLTAGVAAAWTAVFSPLSAWIAPHYILIALFALIGAAGVLAAFFAFEAVVQRRHVLICGLIYAVSLGVWYFASIAESKILTASLSTLYIAIYLHLRERWSQRLALALTAVLAAACANESVSAFLLVIPVLDHLLQRGPTLRGGRWIAAHALAAPLVVVPLVLAFAPAAPASAANPESGSAFDMFWFYARISDHGLESLYGFLLNWIFFNIAAPSSNALAAIPAWPFYQGYFEPSFLNYMDSPISETLIILALLILFGPFVPEWRPLSVRAPGIAWPLFAFIALRGTFFFVFNPAEVMLFSAAVTLPLLILALGSFSVSRVPGRMAVLAVFAVLLLANNLRFVIG
jgi:hypothetical protein